MAQTLDYLKETVSQTAGPYVHIGLAPGAAGFDAYKREIGRDIAGPDTTAPRIKIEGTVFDGTGAPVKDALIEVWQADPNGIYAHPEDPRHADLTRAFNGWGRVIPDFDTGGWTLETIKPGGTPGRGGTAQAPHLNLWIVARGINVGLNTRMYFPEDTKAHAGDTLLNMIEQPDRRQTLIATKVAEFHYRFDIRLQGDGETVFLDI